MESFVVSIPSSLVGDFKATFKKVEKVAGKLGVAGYTFKVLGEAVEEVAVNHEAIINLRLSNKDIFRKNDVTYFLTEVTTIEIAGEMPKIGDYVLVGTVDPTTKISHSAPGENIPAKFLKKMGTCDHCKKVRNRTKNIVVRKGKTYKLVGSACVKDFLGAYGRDIEVEAKKLASYFEFYKKLTNRYFFLEDLDEGGMFFGKSFEIGLKLEDILFTTYAVIKTFGWLSKSKAKELEEAKKFEDEESYVSTSEYMDTIEYKKETGINGKSSSSVLIESMMRSNRNGFGKATEAKKEGYFDKVIDWAKSLGEDNSKEYLRNLSILANLEFPKGVFKKDLGLAVSMISAYEFALKSGKENKVNNYSDSKFLGEKGEKIITDVKVLKVTGFDGNFGFVEIIKMVTSDGNVLTWFSTSKTPSEIDSVGKKAKIKGTIKGINEYKGIKETLLSRVKLTA